MPRRRAIVPSSPSIGPSRGSICRPEHIPWASKIAPTALPANPSSVMVFGIIPSRLKNCDRSVTPLKTTLNWSVNVVGFSYHWLAPRIGSTFLCIILYSLIGATHF